MATTTTNFGWDIPQSTDLVKDGATAIAALGQDIDTAFVDLKGGTTGQVLAKASNTDLDYSWVAQDDSNAIQNAIVDAKGDLIAASAADTPARLAVGANGETLVADSSTSTGLRYQGDYAAGKNAVINGSMQNWQRGTSFTSTGYTADRWYLTSPGSNTVSRSTDTPAGFAYSLKWDLAGASPLLSTYLELPATGVKGQFTGTWTVSFYAKGSTSFNVNFEAAYQNGSNRVDRVGIGSAQTVALTTSWTRYSYTLDLTSPTINANNKAVELLFYMATGANSMYLTGVQFEQASVATAFQTATGTLQGELSACQRYYFRSTPNTNFGNYGLGIAGSTTNAFVSLKLPTTMRVIPTSIDVPSTITALKLTNIAATNWTISAIGLSDSTTDNLLLSITASGMTANQGLILGNNNNTAGFIGASAEL